MWGFSIRICYSLYSITHWIILPILSFSFAQNHKKVVTLYNDSIRGFCHGILIFKMLLIDSCFKAFIWFSKVRMSRGSLWNHKTNKKCEIQQVRIYDTLLSQTHCSKTEKGTERQMFWSRITRLENKTIALNLGRADTNKITLTNVAWWVSTRLIHLRGTSWKTDST